MPSMTPLLDSPVGLRTLHILDRVKALELLDRCYTLAAQTFVALLPLVLVLAALLTSEGEESVIAEDLITRFGLVGAGEQAMRQLIVVSQGGIYWLGVLIILYSAFSLSKRLGRAYNAAWGTPQLPPSEQWRGLVWIGLQVTMIYTVTELRGILRVSGPIATVASAGLILLVWFVGEYLTQSLLTRRAVARDRLLLAAGLVTVGRLGVVVWGGLYLSAALSRQAESYGPIGVVFGLFTSLFASWVAILGGTLLAATLTEPVPPRSPVGRAVSATGDAVADTA